MPVRLDDEPGTEQGDQYAERHGDKHPRGREGPTDGRCGLGGCRALRSRRGGLRMRWDGPRVGYLRGLQELLKARERRVRDEALQRGQVRAHRGGAAGLCRAVLCGAVLCGAVLCGAVLCGAVLCGAVLCGAVLCGAVLCRAGRRRYRGAEGDQASQELVGGGPGSGIAVHGLPYDGAQSRTEAFQIGIRLHDPEQLTGGRACPERGMPGAREDHQTAPGPDVRGAGDAVRADLLGRDEGRCADDRILSDAGGVGRVGDAEVDHAWPERREQNVRRLEIAVDETGPVDRGQRRGDAYRDPFEVRGAQRSAGAHRLCQGGAVDELRDDEGLPVRRVDGVEKFRRAEPGDAAAHLGLAAEPRAERGNGGDVGPDHLDRDEPSFGRAAQVDGAHPALAEPADNAVTGQLGRIPRPQRSHLRPAGELGRGSGQRWPVRRRTIAAARAGRRRGAAAQRTRGCGRWFLGAPASVHATSGLRSARRAARHCGVIDAGRSPSVAETGQGCRERDTRQLGRPDRSGRSGQDGAVRTERGPAPDHSLPGTSAGRRRPRRPMGRPGRGR